MLVEFVGELRAAGVPAGSGDVLTYCAATETLDPTDLADLYWAGRTTLVTRRDQIPLYDRVFRRFYLDDGQDQADPLTLSLRSRAEIQGTLDIPDPEPRRDGDEEERETHLGILASNAEVLRAKSFAACTPEELVALRRIMARIRLTPPRRRTRRTVPAHRGVRPDMRRAVRESLSRHPAVESFRPGGPAEGGEGATVARLRE